MFPPGPALFVGLQLRQAVRTLQQRNHVQQQLKTPVLCRGLQLEIHEEDMEGTPSHILACSERDHLARSCLLTGA